VSSMDGWMDMTAILHKLTPYRKTFACSNTKQHRDLLVTTFGTVQMIFKLKVFGVSTMGLWSRGLLGGGTEKMEEEETTAL